MKLCVLVPVHTSMPVACLSIGSFLRQHEKYDVEVHVGVHSNYSHYTTDLRLFDELRGVAQVHTVDEIDWLGEYNRCFYRYSVMHAKNLENLVKQSAKSDFDYAVILDHDIHVKADFVSKCIERFGGTDLIGNVPDDKDAIWPFTTALGEKVNCLPKISGWHMMISKRFFDVLVSNTALLYPALYRGAERDLFTKGQANLEDLPLFADTLSRVYWTCKNQEPFKVGILKSEEFAGWVRHFFASSFNYGQRVAGNYSAHVAEIEKIYQAEFPNGLRSFRRITRAKAPEAQKAETGVEKIRENMMKVLAMAAEQHATITFNDTPGLPLSVRDRELERLSTAVMMAKAMCVAAGIEEDQVRILVQLTYENAKRQFSRGGNN